MSDRASLQDATRKSPPRLDRNSVTAAGQSAKVPVRRVIIGRAHGAELRTRGIAQPRGNSVVW
jgi:hypothetical protein